MMSRSRLLPEIDAAKCTSCGLCVVRCPENAVALDASGPIISDPAACSYCGVCESVCPVGAIQLMYEILWDVGATDESSGV